MSEYTPLYLPTDDILLAYVFDDFRNVCQTAYVLDPTHYYTSLSLTWDIMLKITGVSFDLSADVIVYWDYAGVLADTRRPTITTWQSMTRLIRKLIWRALTHATWVISYVLQGNDFRWMCNTEMKISDLNAIPSNNLTGHVLEVELEYLKHLLDIHKDLPFCSKQVVHFSQHLLSVLNIF